MADINIDTDSEDELPPGWEERVTIDGKVYYASHETRKTQWTHPVSGIRKKVVGELPYGWEKKIEDNGSVCYIDHKTQKTTFTDPRLAFAVEDKNTGADVTTLRQKFDANSTAMQVLVGRDLTDKYAIVTGANAGIGFETARSLALHGCHVTLACRNLDQATACKESILKENSAAKIAVLHVDLSSFKSVKEFAQSYASQGWPLHMLILNAAVFAPPHTVTDDNVELCFQVNVLSHFLLCKLLEGILKRSAPARIVHVSSESHRYRSSKLQSVDDVVFENLSPDPNTYSTLVQYGVTKLLNIAISNSLNQRLAPEKVFSNSLHPGNLINTSLGRNWWGYRLLFYLVKPFTKSLQQGAATTVFVATSKDLDDVGGMYFNNCWICQPSPLAADQKFCEKVYDVAEKIVLSRMGQDAFNID